MVRSMALMRCTGHPSETSESTASRCSCSSSTPRASLMAYSSSSPLYSCHRAMVASKTLSLTSLWYRFRNACLRAVLRLMSRPGGWFDVFDRRQKGKGKRARGKGMVLSGSWVLNPRQVLVGAGVHAYPVADVDEERHLHDDPGLQRRGLVPARGRVALQAWVGLRDLEVDVRRRLDAHDLPIRREDGDGTALHNVAGPLADDLGGDRHLLVGVGVHEIEQVTVFVEVRHLARLRTHVLQLLPGAEGLLHYGPAVDVPQARPHERAALAGFDVLEEQDRESLSVHADGRPVPELVSRYHARKLPFKAPDLRYGPARREPGADAGLLSHSFFACQQCPGP